VAKSELGKKEIKLSAMISLALMSWFIYQQIFVVYAIGFSPVGFSLTIATWTSKPMLAPIGTLALAILSLLNIGINTILRRRKALILAVVMLVLGCIPWFITILIYEWFAAILLIASVIVSSRESPASSRDILRILITIPFLLVVACLPAYMISI